MSRPDSVAWAGRGSTRRPRPRSTSLSALPSIALPAEFATVCLYTLDSSVVFWLRLIMAGPLLSLMLSGSGPVDPLVDVWPRPCAPLAAPGGRRGPVALDRVGAAEVTAEEKAEGKRGPRRRRRCTAIPFNDFLTCHLRQSPPVSDC